MPPFILLFCTIYEMSWLNLSDHSAVQRAEKSVNEEREKKYSCHLPNYCAMCIKSCLNVKETVLRDFLLTKCVVFTIFATNLLRCIVLYFS